MTIPAQGGYRDDVPPIYRPRMPGVCPMHQAPLMMNMIYNHGRCRKWPGRVQYTPTQLLGGVKLDTAAPIRNIYGFNLSSGTTILVVSDGRDLFKFNADVWNCITPIHTTGTADFGNLGNKKIVTGNGTTWVTDGIQPGMAIKCDDDAVWYEIDTVDGETQITLTEDYTDTGGTTKDYTIRMRRSITGERWISFETALNKLIVVNGVDPTLEWDGAASQMTELANAPIGRFVTAFHQENFLVIGRMNTDQLLIQNSEIGDYTVWDGTGYSGEYPFKSSEGLITGLDGHSEYLWVLKSDGAWQGRWTGAYSQIQWHQETAVIDGPIVPTSYLRLGETAAWFGNAKIWSFDGHNAEEIGRPVREYVFAEDGLDRDYLDSVVSEVQIAWSLAFWSFPIDGSGGIPARTVVYDWAADQWFISDIGYSSFGRVDLNRSDVQWDTLTGTMDAQTRIFDQLGSTPEPVVLAGDEQGYLYYLAWAVREPGITTPASRCHPLIQPAGVGRASEVAEVVIDTTAWPGATFICRLLGSERALGYESGISPDVLDARTAVVGDDGTINFYLRSASKWWAVEISNINPQDEFGLIATNVSWKPRGR
jgi:hypothetical protein